MDTADGILAIPITAPFKLFPRNAGERQHKFHELAKLWHPDKAGRTDVMAHITALRDAADKAVDENLLTLHSRDGKTYQIRAKRLRHFELGTMALCDNLIAFMIDHKHDDLALHGIRQIGSVRYPDDKMRNQHARYVPFVEKVFDTADAEVVVIKKTDDVLLLRDVVEHLGAIDPKHVAWIVSSLLNIACFYEITNLCHNGLSLDTVFVSPQYHAAFPLGGWWYAQKVGQPIKFLPPESHAVAPRSMLVDKVADQRLDLECIRAIARQCLGTNMDNIPKPLAHFVRLPAPKSAIKDYENWAKVLTDSFGPRRFLVLSLKSSDIYA